MSLDRAETLFHWMSHQGEGSQEQLRRAIDSHLCDRPEERRERFRRTFSRRVIELGHVAEPGAAAWRVYAPALALLPCASAAVWCGGRSPGEVERLRSAATRAGCEVQAERLPFGPERVTITGAVAGIECAAGDASIPLAFDAARRAAAGLTSVEMQLREAETGLAPTDANLQSFDFAELDWVDRDDASPALRCARERRGTEYFVREGERLARLRDPYAAIFTAAWLLRIPVCEYDAEARRLVSATRLPRDVSRALCLCSGRPAAMEGARLVYSGVTGDVARLARAALGQLRLTPAIHWF